MSLEGYTYTELEFDSLDCTNVSNNFSSDDSTRNNPSFYLGKPLDNVEYMKVLEAQIPFSFYLINAYNNTALLTEFYTVSPGVFAARTGTVTLPVGNYNSTTICPALVTALNAASTAAAAAFPGSGAARTYTVTVSSLTGKMTIISTHVTPDNEFRLSPILTYEPNMEYLFNSTCFLGWLGYNISVNSGYGDNESTLTVPYTLEAPYILNLSGPLYIYICSQKIGQLVDMYMPNNGVLNPPGTSSDGPQLCKVPLVTNPGTVTNWQDPCHSLWFPTSNTTFGGEVDFFCTLGTDSPRYPIDFNGLGFSLKLGLLVKDTEHVERPLGGYQNNRVVTRTF